MGDLRVGEASSRDSFNNSNCFLVFCCCGGGGSGGNGDAIVSCHAAG